MPKNLYVGKPSYETTDSDPQELFSPHGVVHSGQIIMDLIMDRDKGRSKCFGNFEKNNGDEAQTAINALNGKESNGRALTVNEAWPREDRFGSRSGGARY